MAAAEQSVTPDAGRSIRDELLAAQAEVNERYEKEEPEAPREAKEPEPKVDDRPRDASGRFAPLEEKDPAPAQETARSTPSTAEPVAPPAPAQAEFSPAPQGWTNEEKAIWSKVPAEAQKAMLRREKDFSRAVSAQDEDRNYGREFKRLAQPYEPLFQALGATPVQGFQDYLRIAYTLNTGDANTKLQALQQVATRYGVNLNGTQNTEAPDGTQLPPALMQTISQIAAQQQRQAQELNAWRQQQQQSEMATTMSEIDRFAKDPSHPYFESVREHMATLITGGAATSLQDAYEQAVWARPDIRDRLIAEKTAPQIKEQQSRAKTERARAKAVGVKGGSGAVPDAPRNPNASVREDLEAAFNEARNRI